MNVHYLKLLKNKSSFTAFIKTTLDFALHQFLLYVSQKIFNSSNDMYKTARYWLNRAVENYSVWIKWFLTSMYLGLLNSRLKRISKKKPEVIFPHLWNDDDLWKKNRHSKYWKSPHSYHIVPILARKSSFQYRYLEGFKWPVLQNLSLIYILMKIHEKKFTTFSIGILWTATM